LHIYTDRNRRRD